MVRTPAWIEFALRAPSLVYAWRQYVAEPDSTFAFDTPPLNGGYCLDAPEVLPAGSSAPQPGSAGLLCKSQETLTLRDGWERRLARNARAAAGAHAAASEVGVQS